MAVFFYLGIAVLSFTAWNLIALFRNYRLAKSIGLPVVICPASSFNPVWIILCKFFPNVFRSLRKLPAFLGEWRRCAYFGWQFDDNGEVFRRLGPAFVMCMPAFIEVHVADPALTAHILSRRKEYLKPGLVYDVINHFGVNVDSAEGETWQRHRRLTVPSLSERINGTVWDEATRQCQEMLTEWKQDGNSGTRKTQEDTATLALHVWMRAGFGIHHPFREAPTEKGAGRMTYKEALFEVISNFIVIVIFPAGWATKSFMPKRIRRVGEASLEFRRNMEEMLEKAKKDAEHEGHSQSTLLNALVQASEDAWGGDRKSGIGLDDDEIYGNIWVYSFAGFETTANVLVTAAAYLAAYPGWQEWLIHEVDDIVQKGNTSLEGRYEELFPEMKRVIATMYETLRLHGSVLYLPKITGPQVQILDVGEKSHAVPPNTLLTIDTHAIHCDREIWGSDAMVWRPDRWIRTNADGREELIKPRDGTFLPWADGPRVCPGKKFAQVEFTAVMTTLFRNHKVTAVPEPGQTPAKAQAAALAMIHDSEITNITLQMKHPGAVSLAWQERSSGSSS